MERKKEKSSIKPILHKLHNLLDNIYEYTLVQDDIYLSFTPIKRGIYPFISEYEIKNIDKIWESIISGDYPIDYDRINSLLITLKLTDGRFIPSHWEIDPKNLKKARTILKEIKDLTADLTPDLKWGKWDGINRYFWTDFEEGVFSSWWKDLTRTQQERIKEIFLPYKIGEDPNLEQGFSEFRTDLFSHAYTKAPDIPLEKMILNLDSIINEIRLEEGVNNDSIKIRDIILEDLENQFNTALKGLELQKSIYKKIEEKRKEILEKKKRIIELIKREVVLIRADKVRFGKIIDKIEVKINALMSNVNRMLYFGKISGIKAFHFKKVLNFGGQFEDPTLKLRVEKGKILLFSQNRLSFYSIELPHNVQTLFNSHPRTISWKLDKLKTLLLLSKTYDQYFLDLILHKDKIRIKKSAPKLPFFIKELEVDAYKERFPNHNDFDFRIKIEKRELEKIFKSLRKSSVESNLSALEIKISKNIEITCLLYDREKKKGKPLMTEQLRYDRLETLSQERIKTMEILISLDMIYPLKSLRRIINREKGVYFYHSLEGISRFSLALDLFEERTVPMEYYVMNLSGYELIEIKNIKGELDDDNWEEF
jgi:hypothetical protein